MPNWCSTDMIVYGDNELLLKFKKLIEDVEALPHSTEPGMIDTHNTWLGKFWKVLGYTEEQMESIPCRGWIEGVEYNLDLEMPHIKLWYESAWNSLEESFNNLLKTHFPGLKQVSRVSEPGMCMFYHTDAEHLFFNDEYCLDAYHNGKELYEFYDSKEKFVKAFNDLFGTSFSTYKEVENYIDNTELPDDDWCYISAYEYCN